MIEQRDTNRDRTCKAKRAYRTSFSAFLAAQSASRRAKAWIEYYRCSFCRKFHIGHA